VFREGKGFVVLERRWLVERSFAWLLGCRRLVRCDDGLCEVEACWIEWACVRWLVRRLAREGNARQSLRDYRETVIPVLKRKFGDGVRSQNSTH
jgi:hypothetical protein